MPSYTKLPPNAMTEAPHDGLSATARMRYSGGVEGENPIMAALMGLIGPRQDDSIELPNENGRVDPRLIKPQVHDMLKSATQVLDPIGGLKKAFGR